MLLPIVLACCTMIILSLGQVILKLFAAEVAQSSFTLASLTNLTLIRYVILLIVVYGLVLCLWLFVLQRMELSRAFPFAALTFVFVPLFAFYFLGEVISPSTVVGTILIVGGIVVVTVF